MNIYDSVQLRISGLIVSAGLLSGCFSSLPPQAVDQAKESLVAHDPGAMARIGDVAAAQDEPDAALTFYRRALDLRPDDPDLQLSYARALASSGQASEATDVLRAASRKAPENASIMLALGKLLLAERKPREAAAVLGEAAQTHTSDAALQIESGIALDNSCHHVAAQSAYRQALTAEPDSIAARNDLALSMTLSGDVNGAVAILRPLRAEIVATENNAQAGAVSGNLALAYALSGDQGAAVRINSQELPPDQVDSNAHFYDAVRSAGTQGCDDEAAVPTAPS